MLALSLIKSVSITDNEEGIKEVFFILVKKIGVRLYNTVANLLNKCLPNKAKIKNISFNLFVIGSPTKRSKHNNSDPVQDIFDKDFKWILDLGITSPQSYYQVKQYYFSHILPQSPE